MNLLDAIKPEKLIAPDALKILFVTKDMEDLFSRGASERMNQYTRELGTSLKNFQSKVGDHLRLSRHIRNIANYSQRIGAEELELLHGNFYTLNTLNIVETQMLLNAGPFFH
jgi:hypothetical protein